MRYRSVTAPPPGAPGGRRLLPCIGRRECALNRLATRAGLRTEPSDLIRIDAQAVAARNDLLEHIEAVDLGAGALEDLAGGIDELDGDAGHRPRSPASRDAHPAVDLADRNHREVEPEGCTGAQHDPLALPGGAPVRVLDRAGVDAHVDPPVDGKLDEERPAPGVAAGRAAPARRQESHAGKGLVAGVVASVGILVEEDARVHDTRAGRRRILPASPSGMGVRGDAEGHAESGLRDAAVVDLDVAAHHEHAHAAAERREPRRAAAERVRHAQAHRVQMIRRPIAHRPDAAEPCRCGAVGEPSP
jgi:hypothetical protein